DHRTDRRHPAARRDLVRSPSAGGEPRIEPDREGVDEAGFVAAEDHDAAADPRSDRSGDPFVRGGAAAGRARPGTRAAVTDRVARRLRRPRSCRATTAADAGSSGAAAARETVGSRPRRYRTTNPPSSTACRADGAVHGLRGICEIVTPTWSASTPGSDGTAERSMISIA